MKINITELNDINEIGQELAMILQEMAVQAVKQNKHIYVAIPGGTTPLQFFDHLSRVEMESIWQNVDIFWGDERCVPPEHPDSNYGQTNKILLSKIRIPVENIHRIHGECDPKTEAKRYSKEIRSCISKNKIGWPVFDWIILGMGTDGHTASIFPDTPEINDADSICLVTEHPESGQKRISLGFGIINQAKRITFLVTGESKSRIVSRIINKEPETKNLPAAKIQPANGILELYLDKKAAGSYSTL